LLAFGVSEPCLAVTHKVTGHLQCKVPNGASPTLIDVPRVRVRIDNGAGQEGVTDAAVGFGDESAGAAAPLKSWIV